MSAKRNYSTDLLRCILMIMITAHHIIVHTLNLKVLGSGNVKPDQFDFSLFMLNSLCIIAVNAFFFISGYYSIKLKGKKIVLLYVEMMFYLFIWYLVMLFTKQFTLMSGQSLKYLVNVAFPISTYWFMGAYFLLCILAPFVNEFIDSLDAEKQKKLLITLSVVAVIYGFVFDWDGIGRGHTFLHGLYMYFLGMLCRKNSDKLPKSKLLYLGIYLASSAAVAFAAFVMYRRSHSVLSWYIYSYNDPLIVIGAVSLCLLFIFWDSYSSVAEFSSRISKYVLAVYLITVNPTYVFYPVKKFIEVHNGQVVVISSIIVYSVALFAVCILLDYLREKLFSFIGRILRLEDIYERICDWYWWSTRL
ncbi:MAG: acyltransferase [Ruminococcus sp.]|uniref:acyltransferase family protein n=1 Tax=Ruminococcus sp. TaxID=41978 RepID=UPI0025E4987E|nr:acyltransferase [Ruminococcus sp.]MCR5540430.1 acyltransferase [Ruminococcus sp.]